MPNNKRGQSAHNVGERENGQALQGTEAQDRGCPKRDAKIDNGSSGAHSSPAGNRKERDYMAKYAYPAIFTKEKDGCYSVRFPDVPG